MRAWRDPQGNIHLALSRRNILALLHKLDMPGSARTISSPHPFGIEEEVWLHAEDDGEHYNHPDRAEGLRGKAGRMHDATETFIRER